MMNVYEKEIMTSARPLLTSASSDSDELITSVSDISDVMVITETAVHVPEECYKTIRHYVPWENTNNLISADIVKVLEIVIYCGLMPLLCTVGMVTNSCSCAVFYRLGVKKGINLCLLLLSISDTLFLVTQTMIRSSKILLTLLYGSQGASRWDYTIISYHILRKAGIFLFFSNFLTTLASVERCVSIISPLKARLIFDHSKMVVIIVFVFIVDLASFIVIGFKHKPGCVFDVYENAAFWVITASEAYSRHELAFNILDNLVLIFGFPVLSVTVMVTSTSLILHRLRLAARWRQHTSSSGGAEGSSNVAGISKSETQLYKMLVAMASMHVVCTVPTILKDTSKFFISGFNITGMYSNQFNTILAVKDAMASINCTVNFFIYYGLSMQFRQTLSACFGRQARKKDDIIMSVVSTNVTRGTSQQNLSRLPPTPET